ncbi:MAG: hypothetical protein JXQ87_00085 [Bacteroidia bacterium]
MKKLTIALLIIISSTFKIYAGGAWPQGTGNGFFMLSQRYIGGSFYANNSGDIIDLGDDLAGVFSTHLYCEYGLTNKIDAIVHFQPIVASYYTDEFPSSFLPINGNSTQNAGFGDMDLALKYNFYDDGIFLSATLQFGIPTGRHKPGLYGNTFALTGDGDFNQMIKFDASGGLGSNVFYNVFVGFNNRTNEFSDEFHAGGEIGRNGDKLVSILKIYSLNSFRNGSNFPAGIPGIYSNNLEYLAVSPCFLYKLKNNWGILFEAGFAPMLKNIIAAPSFNIGITKNVNGLKSFEF